MKIEVEIDEQKIVDAVIEVYQREMHRQFTNELKSHIRFGGHHQDLDQRIKAYLDKKAPALIEKIMGDYDNMKERAQATVTASMAQRVARAAKRLEGV